MAKTGDRSRAVPGSALDALHFALDRTSPVPLYYQLAQQLEAAIEHGALAPGNLLGNEIDLSTRLGLSRPTVRQAIQSLVDKGLLVRRRGVGTQVVHSQVKRPLELSSLYDDLEAAGQGPPRTSYATNAYRRPPTWPPRSASRRAARSRSWSGCAPPTDSRWRSCATTCPRPSSTSTRTAWSRPACTGCCARRASPCTAPARPSAPAPPPPRRPPSSRNARGGPAHHAAHGLRRHRPPGRVRDAHLPRVPLRLRLPAAGQAVGAADRAPGRTGSGRTGSSAAPSAARRPCGWSRR